MPKYTYLNLVKRKAKALSKTKEIKLHEAQYILASKAGFRHYHELQTVAASTPNDPRLMRAALGTNHLTEVIYEDGLYQKLSSIFEDSMSSEVADTNATMFTIEDYEPTNASYDPQTGILTIIASISYVGEHEPDQVYHGSSFYLDVEIRLFRAVDHWELTHEDSLVINSCMSDQDLDWEAQG